MAVRRRPHSHHSIRHNSPAAVVRHRPHRRHSSNHFHKVLFVAVDCMHSITKKLVNGLVQAYEEIAKLLADFDLLNKQNNLFKTRDEKYRSTIRVIEALLNGTVESQRIGSDNFPTGIAIKIQKHYLSLFSTEFPLTLITDHRFADTQFSLQSRRKPPIPPDFQRKCLSL
nr:hypothetical protein [Tanacetum cinerariifolium]